MKKYMTKKDLIKIRLQKVEIPSKTIFKVTKYPDHLHFDMNCTLNDLLNIAVEISAVIKEEDPNFVWHF